METIETTTGVSACVFQEKRLIPWYTKALTEATTDSTEVLFMSVGNYWADDIRPARRVVRSRAKALRELARY